MHTCGQTSRPEQLYLTESGRARPVSAETGQEDDLINCTDQNISKPTLWAEAYITTQHSKNPMNAPRNYTSLWIFLLIAL